MRPFDLDLLRSFTVAMESGSLSEAAPRLCRSQSALSEQLRKLEAFTGVTLLERGKKGVRPTPAGERLMVHARELLALSDRALEDVRGVTFAGEATAPELSTPSTACVGAKESANRKRGRYG